MYRILQVEDLPSDAFLVKREIRKVIDSCEFRVVEDNDSFLAALKEFDPHLVVSDFSIPGFSWNAAFSLTKQHSPQIPFIIVTGSTNDEIRDKCLDEGVYAFFSKNAMKDLGKAILSALGTS
jgi:CheY-like chemotaxis protein